MLRRAAGGCLRAAVVGVAGSAHVYAAGAADRDLRAGVAADHHQADARAWVALWLGELALLYAHNTGPVAALWLNAVTLLMSGLPPQAATARVWLAGQIGVGAALAAVFLSAASCCCKPPTAPSPPRRRSGCRCWGRSGRACGSRPGRWRVDGTSRAGADVWRRPARRCSCCMRPPRGLAGRASCSSSRRGWSPG